MAKNVRRYATHHQFEYPKFGKVVRARSDRKLFRKAAGAEDSAFVLYRALNHAPKSQKYHTLIKKLKTGNF